MTIAISAAARRRIIACSMRTGRRIGTICSDRNWSRKPAVSGN